MNDRWDTYFLRKALLAASMSKDPSTKVGAVLVGPDREVRADGFNGFPRGIADTKERLECREVKLDLVVHAEMNAILSAARVGTPTKGCTMYLVATEAGGGKVWGGPPCARCVVEVIQAGVVEVVSIPRKNVPSRWHASLDRAQELLVEAGVNYREVPFDAA